MKFRTYTKQGEIALDASLEERAALIEFIDKSLVSTQVDYDEHSPVDRDALRGLRESIAAQLSVDTGPLIVPRIAFWDLAGVASAWHFFTSERQVIDVSRVMVNRIRALSDEPPMYIGPPGA